MSISIVQYNLGVETVVITDCVTEERAEEFLQDFKETNSRFPLIDYAIKRFWGNSLDSDTLEKRLKKRKNFSK